MSPLALLYALTLGQTAPEAPGPYTVGSDLMVSVTVGAESLTVNLYWPEGRAQAIPAVVGHGFARNATPLSGWGEHLASHGFAVAVPSFPSPLSPDHTANGARMAGLLAWLKTSPAAIGTTVAPTGGVLIGHSAGGLSAIIGAAMIPDLQAVLGLDPVDNMNLGAMAAGNVTAPVVMLAAEAQQCNAQGSAATFFGSVTSAGSWYAKIVGSTHCDGENPSNNLCAITCGGQNPALRSLYIKYGTAHLLAATSCAALDHLPGGSVLQADVTAGALANVAGTGPSCAPPIDGGIDAGAPDSGADAGAPDSGAPDSGIGLDLGVESDSGAEIPDGGAPLEDAGLPADSGTSNDSGVNPTDSGFDASLPGLDAGSQDLGTGNGRDSNDGGCGCHAAERSTGGIGGLALLAMGLLLRRRRQ